MYEILAPAGNKECAVAAVQSGADAIYLGYSAFSARAGAENFDLDALKGIVEYAHIFGVKVYVTMNTVVKEREIEEFVQTLVAVHNLGADAIILQDIFLGKLIHEQYPDVCLHLSTQAGVCNVYGARLAKRYGFSRVVLARETPLKDICAIAQIIQTEVFIQGALCTCLSGQCYLSSFVGGNSGNRGRCKQPCRKKYFYDTGDKKLNYALSLSDLSVGQKIIDLHEAGVISFKIEGRMRRSEYVAAAVRYYKKIINGQNAELELSELKRTYNRGNYTQGLAFSQDKRFLSKAVQGHIGEKVGVVKVVNGKYYVETAFCAQTGDGFKILRGGEEVGGASFSSKDKRGFYLATKSKLKNGDGVFITTDTALNKKLLSTDRKYPFNVQISAQENGALIARGAGVTLTSDFTLESAKNAPMSENDFKNCFLKIDEYPFAVQVDSVTVQGNCFLPKARLNAFRREFYRAVYQRLTQNKNTVYEYHPLPLAVPKVSTMPTFKQKIAVIGEEFSCLSADIYIFKPKNYADAASYQCKTGAKGEKFLYLPAFLTSEEVQSVQENLSGFDGVYAEGTYAVELAKQWNKKLFAGTGFHITNPCALQAEYFDYYALSKEISLDEQRSLARENAFVLSVGDIKVMDLLYCPFEKKCSACANRNRYTLTDENGREFPVRRYKTSQNTCRFELYNCAHLVATQSFANVLTDVSTLPMPTAKGVIENCNSQEKLKEILPVSTLGHSRKSVL